MFKTNNPTCNALTSILVTHFSWHHSRNTSWCTSHALFSLSHNHLRYWAKAWWRNANVMGLQTRVTSIHVGIDCHHFEPWAISFTRSTWETASGSRKQKLPLLCMWTINIQNRKRKPKQCTLKIHQITASEIWPGGCLEPKGEYAARTLAINKLMFVTSCVVGVATIHALSLEIRGVIVSFTGVVM